MKRENVNYLAAGLLVLAALTFAFIVLLQMTGRGGDYDTYFTRFESVTGIKSGTPVYYEGYLVGQVNGVQPERSGSGLSFKVELAIDHAWPIPTDSVATMDSAGLLSDMFINIGHGDSEEFLAPSGLIPSVASGDMFAAMGGLATDLSGYTDTHLVPLTEELNETVTLFNESLPHLLTRADTILDGVDSIVLSAGEILGPEARQNVAALLKNADTLSANLVARSEELAELREGADQLIRTANQTLTDMSPQLVASSVEIQQLLTLLNQRAASIVSQLDVATRHLESFANEVRQQPNRLLIAPDVKEDAL